MGGRAICAARPSADCVMNSSLVCGGGIHARNLAETVSAFVSMSNRISPGLGTADSTGQGKIITDPDVRWGVPANLINANMPAREHRK